MVDKFGKMFTTILVATYIDILAVHSLPEEKLVITNNYTCCLQCLSQPSPSHSDHHNNAKSHPKKKSA